MLGLKIQGRKNWNWVALPGCLALGSLLLAFIFGPRGIVVSSGLGLFTALVGFLFSLRRSETFPHWGYPLLAMAIHGVFLGGAGLLYVQFLKPLSSGSLVLPEFSRLYEDPDGNFDLKGPEGWHYQRKTTSTGSGVQIEPRWDVPSAGVAQITVRIRVMDHPPENKSAFLRKMVSSSFQSHGKNSKKPFDFHTEKARLNRGGMGVFAVLDIKHFWIPIRQVSLFGFGGKTTFCAISVVGLKAHSSMFRVLCLKIFENIEIQGGGSS